MICTYLRSSSVNTWYLCQLRYIMEYMFGLSARTNKAAAKGSIVHKIFELRGSAVQAEQNKQSSFDDDNFGTISTKWAKDYRANTPTVFEYYKKKEKLNLDTSDLYDVQKWTDKLFADYPQYDPVNLTNIVALEQFFDIEIEEDWAKYDFKIGDHHLSGSLGIRGTIDSILDLGNDVYEIFDLKTGKYRSDFKTGETKDLDYLQNDKQLLFYLYAIKKYLFPDKTIILSLYYVNAGGIFSVIADDEMLQRAEELIRTTFKQILTTFRPSVLDRKQSCFQCRVCPFSKPLEQYGGKSTCSYFYDKIKNEGLPKVLEENIDRKAVETYTSGGGRDRTKL